MEPKKRDKEKEKDMSDMLAEELMDMLYKQDQELYGNVYMFLKRVLKDEEEMNEEEHDIRGLKRHCDDYCTELHSLNEYYESDAAQIVYELRNMDQGELRDRAIETRINKRAKVYEQLAGSPGWIHESQIKSLTDLFARRYDSGDMSEEQLEELSVLA